MIKLRHRAVLKVSGKDALPFMQRLASNNMNKNEKITYSTMLNNKGKILFDFFLHRDGSHNILMDCDLKSLDSLIAYFEKYKFRSDINFDPVSNEAVFSSIDNKSNPDPRSHNIGSRVILPSNTESKRSDSLYHKVRMNNLIPEFDYDIKSNALFPFELGMEYAVDYNKGCYIGQEVVARTHYTGKIRKGIFLISLQGESEYGMTLRYHNDKLGKVLGRIDDRALALLYKDKAQEFSGLTLQIDGTKTAITIHTETKQTL